MGITGELGRPEPAWTVQGGRVRLRGAACLVFLCWAAQAGCASGAESPTRRGFELSDLARLADLSEPDLSTDGERLLYTVSTVNGDEDLAQSDLWEVGYDGRQRRQLTHTPKHSESRPQWSPDGRAIAFLSDAPAPGSEDKDEEEATNQVWIMAAGGAAPRRLSSVDSGVEDFLWSPDGQRLALVVRDPERPAGIPKPKNPPPLLIDRFLFKEDGVGYLDHRRLHLYLLDIASGRIEQLTSGDHDEQLPAWSPDGRWLAYVSKRGADPDRHFNFDIYLIEPRPGASERRLTTFPGADLDPYWETRPAWSPDSRRIAYLQSGDDKWIYYAPWQLAVIDVDSGKAGIPAPIDRCFSKPRWAPDGRSIYALVEQSRVTHLSRVDLATGAITELTHGQRFDYDLSVSANGRVVVLGGGDTHPYSISAVQPRGRSAGAGSEAGLRRLADHNEFLADHLMAPVEPFRFRASDGAEIEGLLVKPVGYVAGRSYPTIVRVHGGPVYQFSHEFMPDWQAYAARGYAVLAINPRGSSGRGFDFSRAIYADWGNRDARDVLEGIDHLVAAGVADPQRLGIGGWSYGGILTNSLIAQDTRFKAAISGAGASNMYAMYGHDQYIREYEIELGTPWKNRELYDRASFPFLHADRIRTPTLFQCAAEDMNVPCLGAEQMYQALRSQEVPTQLVIYPGENHQLVVPSYLRDRLARNLDWYGRYLQNQQP